MAHPHPVAVFPTPRRRVHLLREAAAAGSRAHVRMVVRYHWWLNNVTP
jgi:hypothetical protein